MTTCCIIEMEDRPLGLVTREGDSYRFHASAREASPLDGRMFPSETAAIMTVQAEARRQGTTASNGGARGGPRIP